MQQGESQIALAQKPYVAERLKIFRMVDCNTTKTPMETHLKLKKEGGGRRLDAITYKSLIGSFRYLLLMQPNLTYLVSILSRHMVNPTFDHRTTAKRMLKYLKSTINFSLNYEKGVKELKLISYKIMTLLAI